MSDRMESGHTAGPELEMKPGVDPEMGAGVSGETAAEAAATARRKARMGVLARAGTADLRRLWAGLGLDPECELLRGPEVGLIALRGRIGGGGAPFNVGEATVTRATVRLGDGTVGHSAMLGRDGEKAKLAAVIDALCEAGGHAERIERDVIAPLKAMLDARDARRSSEAAATRVDFFTMVRGDN